MKKLLPFLLLLAGCNELATPTPVEKAKTPPPSTSATYTIPSNLKNTFKEDCYQCHSGLHAANSGYPAGVEVHPGSPWTLVLPSGVSVQDLHTAIAKGKAPANHPLGGSEKQDMIDWIVMSLGATATTYYRPNSFYWNQNTHQSGLTIPGDGHQAGGYHGMWVEMLSGQPTLYIQSFTDGNSLTKTELRFTEQNTCPPDTFSSSDDPVVYVVPAGVEWCHFLDDNFEAGGYIRAHKRIFFALDTQEMRQGGTVNTRRDFRDYVKIEIEASTTRRMAWNSKIHCTSNSNCTDRGDLETVGGWMGVGGGISADPYLANDAAAAAGVTWVDTTSASMVEDKYYYLKVWAWRTDSGTKKHYKAQLWTKEPSIGGASKMGECQVVRSNAGGAWGGFAWGFYEHLASGDLDAIADWYVSADLKDGGHEEGGCRDCEIEEGRPAP